MVEDWYHLSDTRTYSMCGSGASCSACGAELPTNRSCRELCDELSAYTLTHGDPEFIHQYMVDAYAAQHFSRNTKQVTLAAALIGLYLFVERGYTGKQVQQAHMWLGNQMKGWPVFPAPLEHACLSVADALNAPPGPQRDEVIRQWARSVWEMWKPRRAQLETLLRTSYGGL